MAWGPQRLRLCGRAATTKALHRRDPQRLLQETFQVAQKTWQANTVRDIHCDPPTLY